MSNDDNLGHLPSSLPWGKPGKGSGNESNNPFNQGSTGPSFDKNSKDVASDGASDQEPTSPKRSNRWKRPTQNNPDNDPNNDPGNSESGSKKPSGKPDGRSANKTNPRSSKEAVSSGNDKADRQRQKAAAAGASAAKGAGLSKDDQNLAGGLGADLSDVKNSQGIQNKAKAARGAAEKGGRMVLNKKTGGASEKFLNTEAGKASLKVLRFVAAAQAMLPLLLVGLVFIIAVAVVTAITGSAGSDANIEYALNENSPMSVEEEYLRAYQLAGNEHDVPWTVLAGIAQVATEHGRYAPSDVADYGMLVDRAPYAPPIGSIGFSSSSDGRFSPPKGSDITMIGDSFTTGVQTSLPKALPGYELSVSGTNGATIDDLYPKVESALKQGTKVVIVQAGVNDIYLQRAPEKYQPEITSLMDVASSSTCFVWVNLQAYYGGKYAGLASPAATFNNFLATSAASRPWVSIANVASSLVSPEYQSTDGLHLTSAGYKIYTDVIARTVQSCVKTREVAPTTDIQGSETTPPASTDTTPTTQKDSADPKNIKRTTSSGEPVKVDPEYGRYVCKDDVCGPYPKIGTSPDAPRGPFQLKSSFVKKNGFGRAPDDVSDAADILAEELSRIRDEALDAADGIFDDWKDDPVVARQLWVYVVSQAPVVLPSASDQGECAAGPDTSTQGATLSWPVANPVSLGEFGSASTSSETVQLSGITLSGSGQNVTAAGAGSVVDVINSTNGSSVLIVHELGFTSKYSKLVSTTVSVGDKVSTSTIIGKFKGSFVFETLVESSPRNPRLYVANASSVAFAASSATDPQGTPAEDDPQAGTLVDPCTGLKIVPAVSTGSSASFSGAGIPQSLVMPVVGVQPSQLGDSFGAGRDGNTRKHEGIDIVIPKGTPLVAVIDSTVFYAGEGGQPCKLTGKKGLGVTLRDSAQNHYYYGHMDKLLVSDGQSVVAGQVIGLSGDTGNACPGQSVPHLHFSINEGKDNVVNPYPILSKARPLRLSDFAGSLDADTLASLEDSISLSGSAGLVVGFASYYGGLIQDDPDAGKFPGGLQGLSSTGGALGETGAELAAASPLVAEIIRIYFPKEQWDNAIRVANCESRLNPDATGYNKDKNGKVLSTDRGLFQFNDPSTLQGWLTRTGEDPTNVNKAYDPHWSAKAAAMKVKSDGNWGAWSCAHTPLGNRTYGLSIVSISPKEQEYPDGSKIDYSWQVSGSGDTSKNFNN